jgi:hypothetical protein
MWHLSRDGLPVSVLGERCRSAVAATARGRLCQPGKRIEPRIGGAMVYVGGKSSVSGLSRGAMHSGESLRGLLDQLAHFVNREAVCWKGAKAAQTAPLHPPGSEHATARTPLQAKSPACGHAECGALRLRRS